VQELMSRKTFLGVIVHAEEDLKGKWKGERYFHVHVNANLDVPQASRLLEVLANRMDEPEEF